MLGVGLDPSLTDKTPEEHYKKALSDKRISDILKDAQVKNSLSGYGRYGLLGRHAVGNIMMVGDAGRFSDPFLCYGVRQAILSGYNAATICKSSLESRLSDEPCSAYENSMKDLQDQIKLGLFLRKVFRRLDNKDIDNIVKIVVDAQDDGLNVDYLFKGNNNLLLKHIIRNMGGCSRLLFKAIPYLLDYVFNSRKP